MGFLGWILRLFFRGREEESTEKGKRNFSGLWGKNFSGFLEEDAALWSQSLLLKGRFFQVSKAVCLSCWIYSHMCMLCSGFHSNLLIFFYLYILMHGCFFLNGYSTILSYLSTCPIYNQAHGQPKEMWLICLPILCPLTSVFLGLSFLYFCISIPSLSLLLVFWAMGTMMAWIF